MKTKHSSNLSRAAVPLLLVVLGTAVARAQTPVNAERKLEPRADAQAGIRVEVIPQPLVDGKPLVFDIYINTHSVDLAFDVTEIGVLEDREGSTYRPTAWEGSPPGGHHRSGRLTFPPPAAPDYLKLTLKGIGGVDRVFEWQSEDHDRD